MGLFSSLGNTLFGSNGSDAPQITPVLAKQNEFLKSLGKLGNTNVTGQSLGGNAVQDLIAQKANNARDLASSRVGGLFQGAINTAELGGLSKGARDRILQNRALQQGLSEGQIAQGQQVAQQQALSQDILSQENRKFQALNNAAGLGQQLELGNANIQNRANAANAQARAASKSNGLFGADLGAAATGFAGGAGGLFAKKILG